jgi:hypothetical protein
MLNVIKLSTFHEIGDEVCAIRLVHVREQGALRRAEGL